mmetsp:Transcript_33587/g.78513  ORF Transcript_33587/g.78513 Transcript_33587/m.78513 type:complete len:396 (-) Transcript_33587:37-1224(-)
MALAVSSGDPSALGRRGRWSSNSKISSVDSDSRVVQDATAQLNADEAVSSIRLLLPSISEAEARKALEQHDGDAQSALAALLGSTGTSFLQGMPSVSEAPSAAAPPPAASSTSRPVPEEQDSEAEARELAAALAAVEEAEAVEAAARAEGDASRAAAENSQQLQQQQQQLQQPQAPLMSQQLPGQSPFGMAPQLPVQSPFAAAPQLPANDWAMAHAADGTPYWYSPSTGESRWEAPGVAPASTEYDPWAGLGQVEQQFVNQQQEQWAQWFSEYSKWFQSQFQAQNALPGSKVPKLTEPREDASADEKMAYAVKSYVLKEMIGMMEEDAPVSQRKKALKSLQVRWHPDKNADKLAVAKDIFQFIGETKHWFLAGEDDLSPCSGGSPVSPAFGGGMS